MAGNGNSRRFQDFMPHLTSTLTFRGARQTKTANLSYAIHMDGKDLTKGDLARKPTGWRNAVSLMERLCESIEPPA